MATPPCPDDSLSGYGAYSSSSSWEDTPSADRFNIVIVGDGFAGTREDLDRFTESADTLRNYILATPPFSDLRCALKFHRITYSSTNSLWGVDVTDCEPNPNPGTMFGADFCSHGVERACTVDWCEVLERAMMNVPEFHRVIVIVNNENYGASAKGRVAVTTLHSHWLEVAMHELGHTFDLGEEYPFEQGCGLDTNRDSYASDLADPYYHNVTNDPQATDKWADLIDPGTPTPTTQMPADTCDQCDYNYTDEMGNAICQDQFTGYSNDLVGTFESAGEYHCGLYRPVYDCKMRNLYTEFCPVCQRAIRDEVGISMPELSCPAPTFEAMSGWRATVMRAYYRFLAWWYDLIGQGCKARQQQFRADNLETGNDDPCIDLPEP